jgi:uncharacterized membrane protein YfcA
MFQDFAYLYLGTTGVKTHILIPPLVAFVISTLTSTGGVSGAFLILPFQVSYLKFAGPSVSATNFVYNLVAIPGGVYRYVREGRMAWPLTVVIALGTLPGVFFGYYVRVRFLPDARSFKAFVGVVLLYLGLRLLYDFAGRPSRRGGEMEALEQKFRRQAKRSGEMRRARRSAGLPADAVVKGVSVTAARVVYDFWGQRFSFSVPAVSALSLVVGLIGGAYGIGGGSIIAPICVSLFRLPVYTVAGAALMGTFITSAAGVLFYSLVPINSGISHAPDWFLGILFGLGGIPGMYCGARLQKFVPQKTLKLILGCIITFLAAGYVWQYLGSAGR